MRVGYLQIRTVPKEPNRAVYQRPKFLRNHADLTFFLNAFSQAPDDVVGDCDVVRSPVNLRPGRVLSERAIKALYYLWGVWGIPLEARRRGLDVIYTFRNETAVVGYLCQRLGFKWVIDILDDPGLELERRPTSLAEHFWFASRSLHVRLLKRWIRRADLVVACIMPQVLADYDIPAERALFISNGTRLDMLRQLTDRLDTTPPLRYTACYVGAVIPERGIEQMLRAVALAREAIPDIVLEVVGPCTDRDRRWVDGLAHELGVRDHIRVRGQQPHADVVATVARAHVCVYPFPRTHVLNYIYPIKIFEYLAVGRVVIANDLDGIKAIITDGDNGLLVRAGDPRAMADAMIRAHGDPDLCERLTARARQTVQQYDWDAINSKVAERLLALEPASDRDTRRS